MSFTTGSTGGTYQHSHEHGNLYAKMITTPNSLILHGEECGQSWQANGGFDVSGGTQKNESAYWGVDLVGSTSKNANIFSIHNNFLLEKSKIVILFFSKNTQ